MANNKRIKYNTPVEFPASFTLRELKAAGHHKIKYITLYARVRKALDNGTLVEAGLKEPDKTRRGRKEVIYRVIATPDPVATADVAVPASTNW